MRCQHTSSEESVNLHLRRAIEVKPEDVAVSYKDVGGADEAIAELQEIFSF